MNVYEVQKAFGFENLKVAQRDEPKPGPRQILVKVHATSINYRDLLMVQGFYNPKQPLPLIPFSDGVGEVEEVHDPEDHGHTEGEQGVDAAPTEAVGHVLYELVHVVGSPAVNSPTVNSPTVARRPTKVYL